MPLGPRGEGIRLLPVTVAVLQLLPEQPHAGSELLGYCSSVWGEGTGRGTRIRSPVRLQTVPQSRHRPAGLCGKRGGRWGGGGWAASGSPSPPGLGCQQRGPAFRQQPTLPPRDTHELSVPRSDGQQRRGRVSGACLGHR